jgi:hypothetical protein
MAVFGQFSPASQIVLVVNPYAPSDPIRASEIQQARQINDNSPYVNRIVEVTTPRATFADLLQAAQSVSDDEIACLANYDISFGDDSLKWCKELKHGECFALSPWKRTVHSNGMVGMGINKSAMDAWMFRGKPPLFPNASFFQGVPDCDWRLADMLHFDAGIKVSDPYDSIKIFHHHADDRRPPNLGRVPRDPNKMIPVNIIYDSNYLPNDPNKP